MSSHESRTPASPMSMDSQPLKPVRGSYSASVPRSSLARVHREFVNHIVEDEADGQEEGQDDKRDGVQSGVVEESQNKHMRMTHDARMTNTRLEPRMCV